MVDFKNLTDNQKAFLADWICRFNLDLMPGMQMRIDADLNDDKLTQEEAKERLELVSYIHDQLEAYFNENNLSEY